LAILKDLAAYRFLDTNQILTLHPNISARTLRSRLQLLFHAGLVERPIGQVAYYEHPHLVYTLAKKGAALVSENDGLPLPSKPAKELGVSFLRHSLMISNFAAVLKLALKNAGAELAVWRELGPIDAVQCEGERLPIAPDAFFTIKDKGDFLHFFLEIDRSTMVSERVLKKFKGYWNWWTQGGHTKKLEIHKFRVLTVCLSPDRAENLRQIAKKADDARQGSNMFWFGCEKSYSLKDPDAILSPIWKTPKNELPHCLLE
jgi:hypothetical protein